MSLNKGKVQLSVFDAICLMVGVVVGVGIFRTPSVVASNSGSEWAFFAFWGLGALISFVGALCYAELSTSRPDLGGEYSFLTQAYGRVMGFFFAWGRLSVIQTGAIAIVAYVLGDYLSQIMPLGPQGPTLYAAASIIGLTLLNLAGLASSKALQNVLTVVTLLTIALIAGVGFFATPAVTPIALDTVAVPSPGIAGVAMIFVLLTFGGWNEAAYLASELRDVKRNMVKVLFIGLAVVTATYLLINLAYLKVLGLEGMRASDAVAADLLRVSFGEQGAVLISVMIAFATLTTLNATIFTGARSGCALGRDFRVFNWLGHWNERGATPANALIAQAAIALVLVIAGAFTRTGFVTMVEYTAPVFWFFFLLTAVSLFVFRRRFPQAPLPFRVPLYPITPILFCCSCAYMLYSSLMHTGVGALLGVGMLVLGLPLYYVSRRMESSYGRVALCSSVKNP
jgi:basic amino acid/polyamine antiporter, APA family